MCVALRVPLVVACAFLCAYLTACTGQIRQQSPLTAEQRRAFDEPATSRNSPKDLKQTLADIDAGQNHRNCQDRAEAMAQQMQMLGMANAATMSLGRIDGRATSAAARMMAISQAKSIQAQMSRLPPCIDPES